MRFPLRLTADLTLGLVLRSLPWKRDHPLVLNSATGGSIDSSTSPIVWIGGSEPLDLPETPRIVNALAAAGRHVFLPTNGILLRRRIHEFQPSARLHLTVRFEGSESSHDQRARRSGAFRDALESVRTARLSGFFLCAQLILHAPNAAGELERLFGEIHRLDFDGFLILSASAGGSHQLQRTVAALRRRLLSRRWAMLSTLLDSVVTPAPAFVEGAPQVSARVSHQIAEHLQPQNYEESVQAP